MKLTMMKYYVIMKMILNIPSKLLYYFLKNFHYDIIISFFNLERREWAVEPEFVNK